MENRTIHMLLFQVENEKWKMEGQVIFLIHLPFAHSTNRSLSIVHLLTKKQIEVIRVQMD